MYKQLGKENEALLILDSCRTYFENHLENRGETWDNTFNLSGIYALLGEKEMAVQYLLKAVDIGMEGGWHDLIEINPYKYFNCD